MSTQTRVARGVRAGGQFSIGTKDEPLFTLEPDGAPQPPVLLHTVGFNDEQTSCDRCGRVELRGTVVLADDDGNEVHRMGTTCAGKTLGVQVTRDGARRQESVRRSYVFADLRESRALVDQRRFAFAAQSLADARRQGLHRTDEMRIAGQLEHEIVAGLAARTERWGVISRPGRRAVEVDTFAEAQAAATAYARFGGVVVRLDGDHWVPSAA